MYSHVIRKKNIEDEMKFMKMKGAEEQFDRLKCKSQSAFALQVIVMQETERRNLKMMPFELNICKSSKKSGLKIIDSDSDEPLVDKDWDAK